MRRDTLKRALWTALVAWGTWFVLRALGAPSLVALIGPGCVVVMSHLWSGAFALARAAAEPVPVNTPDEQLRHASNSALTVSMEIGLALPRVFVSNTMNRYVFASGRSRYNPAVCIHTDLLADGYEEALLLGLRSELWAAKNRLPQHGTLWAACGALTLCIFTW